MRFFTYLFWPRPAALEYSDPRVIAALAICTTLIVLALIIKRWRRGLTNSVTRRLSRSWTKAGIWFGILGLFLIVCRVEDIHYLAMRFWWLLWGLALVWYLFFQIKIFKARYYEKLPATAIEDPRSKYLPSKRKR